MQNIEWTTLEYTDKDRGSDWFWAVGIIIVSAAVSSVMLDNLLFAIFIIVAGIALILQVLRKPKTISVKISERGVEMDGTLYLYQSLESFWIEADREEYKLILKSKKALVPYAVATIEDVDPDDVHYYLSQFLEEHEMHEPLSQKIMDRLGF